MGCIGYNISLLVVERRDFIASGDTIKQELEEGIDL